MKTQKIIYWTTTGLIFLSQGVGSAMAGYTEMSREGMAQLGYPSYFGPTLTTFKILGALALIIPQVPARLKEWAYAGFVFDFLFAAISIAAVNGFTGDVIFPFITLAVLMASYFSWHKLRSASAA